MNDHMTSLIYLYYIIMDECTFGLIEGKSPSVTYERIQANVNSTGVLLIYL
jgi:hypothetical protein